MNNPLSTEPIDQTIPIAVAILALRAGGMLTIPEIGEYMEHDIQMEADIDHDAGTIQIRAWIADNNPQWMYLPPFGMPLHWQKEQTQIVQRAVTSYLNHTISSTPISDEDLGLTIRYIQYYTCAPVWQEDPRVSALIEKCKNLSTVEDVEEFHRASLEIGLEVL